MRAAIVNSLGYVYGSLLGLVPCFLVGFVLMMRRSVRPWQMSCWIALLGVFGLVYVAWILGVPWFLFRGAIKYAVAMVVVGLMIGLVGEALQRGWERRRRV